MTEIEYPDYERTYAFLGEQETAMAMDVEDDDCVSGQKFITLAMTFCNKSDSFRRDIARNILNGRLDSACSMSDTPFTYQFTYMGEKPRKDIFKRLIDCVRTNTHTTHFVVRKDGSVLIGQIIQENSDNVVIDNGIDIVRTAQSDIISRKLVATRRNVDKLKLLMKEIGNNAEILETTNTVMVR